MVHSFSFSSQLARETGMDQAAGKFAIARMEHHAIMSLGHAGAQRDGEAQRARKVNCEF